MGVHMRAGIKSCFSTDTLDIIVGEVGRNIPMRRATADTRCSSVLELLADNIGLETKSYKVTKLGLFWIFSNKADELTALSSKSSSHTGPNFLVTGFNA